MWLVQRQQRQTAGEELKVKLFYDKTDEHFVYRCQKQNLRPPTKQWKANSIYVGHIYISLNYHKVCFNQELLIVVKELWVAMQQDKL